MEKIKILYPYHLDCLPGAPATVHREVRKRLVKEEFRIDYLETPFPSFVKRFRKKLRPLAGYFSSAPWNIKHLLKNYDIIQTGPSYFHLFWKFFSDQSIHVHLSHGTTPTHLPEETPYTGPRRWLFMEADHIIAVSKYIQRKIKEQIGKNSTVIHNGADVEKFSPDKRERSILKKYDLEHPLVLYVGRFVEGKRPDLVLRIAKEFKNIDFAIRGSGPLESDLKRYKREKNLKNVKFLPYLSEEDLAKLYASSDVLLYPTEYEPCALSVSEALASGLPVIAHKSGGTKEVVSNEVGFLTEENSVPEVKNCLSILLKDEDLRKRMSEKARERCVKRFSWDVIAKKYGEFYRQVAGEGGK